MARLEQFGAEFWIGAGAPVASLGFRYPTRMAVIRLQEGGLFVWSPIALDAELRAAVDALGPVRFLVAPNALHHLALPAWKRAYPDARLFAAPGLRRRRPDLVVDEELSADAPAAWAGEIDQALMRANLITTEAVFFHRRSGVVLFCDLLQNFAPGWFSGWRALVARLDGMIGAEPRTPQKFRAAFTDRAAARAALAVILSWPAEKVLAAHATPVEADARAFLRRAFRWLDGVQSL